MLHEYERDESIKEDDRLGVPQEYFVSAYETVYEIGVKLSRVFWRKPFPGWNGRCGEQSYKAQLWPDWQQGISPCGEASQLRLQQVEEVLERSLPTGFSGQSGSGIQMEGWWRTLQKDYACIDWSAKAGLFKLADPVFMEDWNRAAKVMKRFWPERPAAKLDYRDWLLFRDRRKQENFRKTYEHVYKESFAIKSEVKNKEPLSAPTKEKTPDSEQLGLLIGCEGLNGAPDPTEEIHLPKSIQSCIVERLDKVEIVRHQRLRPRCG
jgi:hypothetical protein